MNRTRYPCRQLNSQAIRSAALCYISPIIAGKCSIIRAQCLCKVNEEGLETAWNDVCLKREACDKAISGIKNVAFFFSSISAQGRKKPRGKNRANNNKDGDESNDSGDDVTPSQLASSATLEFISNYPTVINDRLFPSLNYWIALTTPNGAPANPITIHRALLDINVDTTAKQVPCYEGKESVAMKELFQVLKDHKNPMIQELVNNSYQTCFQREMETFFGDCDVDCDCGTENVARCCLINPSYSSTLQKAMIKLRDAKLTVDLIGFDDEIQSIGKGDDEARLGDSLTVLINDIGIAMKKMQYALFRGKIYKKKENAKYTYAYKCEVSAFINCIAANEAFKGRLLKNMKRVIDILADPDCEVVRPITVDYNLIEVNAGRCWSIKERRFIESPIPEEKIGLVTPRAFTKYDSHADPDPKYFGEILENSLTDSEISEFCDDFLKLLNFNQKRHKDRVPCLIGDANSGKTSLFQPILGLIHHSNIATVTKQRAFNKAMITKSTEVIFIDEASTSTMEIDDWKILTQGGYTAADVKYQTAKSFINRCPMLLTAQQKLKFKPEDQPAMDRRLRNYTFKSLPAPKKKAAEWLRKHPMHCVAWAAEKARRAANDDSEDSEDSDEEVVVNIDGTLPESEKEALRNMSLADALGSTVEENSGEHAMIDESGAERDSSSDECVSQDQDEIVTALKKALEQCSPTSLRHRQVSQLLETRLKEVQLLQQFEERAYEERQQNLISRGVAEEHVGLLSRDSSDPLPTPIQRDLDEGRVQAQREELLTKRNRAKEAFKAPWLQETERELHQCTTTLPSVSDRARRASMEAYREVLQDKIKSHHYNLGTLKCEFALEERRRWCCAEGLLKKEHRHLVTSLFQILPIIEDLGESSQQTQQQSSPPPLEAEKSSDDEADFFKTQESRTQVSGTAQARLRPTLQKKRKSTGGKGNPKKKPSTRPITSWFPSQN
ncbi:hypothetical protein ACROYT_G005051 [Oculina patagonica]